MDFLIFNLGYSRTSIPIFRRSKADAFDLLAEHTTIQPYRAFGGHKIANILRRDGFTVSVVDFLFHFSTEEFAKICQVAKNRGIKAVMFSFMFGNLYYKQYQDQFLEYLKIAKELGLVIVAGGKLRGKFDNHQQLKSYCNYIVYNEAERLISKIAADIVNGRKDLAFLLDNEKDAPRYFPNTAEDNRNLAIIIHKDDAFFDGEPSMIEFSRGCIFNCSFCNMPQRNKSKLDYIIDPDELYEMLMYNYEHHKITNYFVVDSTFNDSVEKLESIRDTIKRLPFSPAFSGYLRPELLIAKPETVQLIKEIGFKSGMFGIESLTPQTLRAIKKRLSYEDMVGLFKKLKSEIKDFNVNISLIAGLPYETADEIEANFTKLAAEWCIDFVKIAPLTIFNGDNPDASEFEQNYANFGYEFMDESQKTVDAEWVNTATGTTFIGMLELSNQLNRLPRNVNVGPNAVGAFSYWYQPFFDQNTSGLTLQNFYQRHKEKVLKFFDIEPDK